MKRLASALLATGAVVFAACADDPNPVSPEVDAQVETTGVTMDAKKGTPFTMDPALQADIEARLTDFVQQKAASVAAMRAEAGVELPDGVEVTPLGFSWIGHLDGETVGTEVFFNDRGNKQLPLQWVPNDPRRGGRDDIGYAFIETTPSFYEAFDVTAAQTFAAIDRAMATWADQSCSKGLTIPKGTFQEWLDFESDVLHDGFFPTLGPDVIGVTSPFIFTEGGVPTDIDNDGALDYAFAIISYSAEFPWGIDTNVFPFIDLETVALHEMGHGLGQAHFGKAFETLANGKVHFAPRSLMNAGYSGLQQSLSGTDRGGHCSMYGSWPNN